MGERKENGMKPGFMAGRMGETGGIKTYLSRWELWGAVIFNLAHRYARTFHEDMKVEKVKSAYLKAADGWCLGEDSSSWLCWYKVKCLLVCPSVLIHFQLRPVGCLSAFRVVFHFLRGWQSPLPQHWLKKDEFIQRFKTIFFKNPHKLKEFHNQKRLNELKTTLIFS